MAAGLSEATLAAVRRDPVQYTEASAWSTPARLPGNTALAPRYSATTTRPPPGGPDGTFASRRFACTREATAALRLRHRSRRVESSHRDPAASPPERSMTRNEPSRSGLSRERRCRPADRTTSGHCANLQRRRHRGVVPKARSGEGHEGLLTKVLAGRDDAAKGRLFAEDFQKRRRFARERTDRE